jgi:two-component system, chemotaxis family, chemotaxis protein CheY
MSLFVQGSAKPVVLVVDDDVDVREALADLLNEAGYRSVCKPDGREALKYLHKHGPPAAVLLDLFMPAMNGWEFMDRLKATPRLAGVPVIMVTANQPHWGYPVRESMVLRKPVDPDRLLDLLRALVQPDAVAS